MFDKAREGYGALTESLSSVVIRDGPLPAIPEIRGRIEDSGESGPTMSLVTSQAEPSCGGSLHVRVAEGGLSTWVQVSGEADFSVAGDLGDALGRVPVEGTQVVHLDLRELTFADADAVRQLGAFARSVRAGGRDVRTSGAGRGVRRVAAVVGVADELGLV